MEPWIAWHEGGLVLAAPPVPRPPGAEAAIPLSWALRPLHAVTVAWLLALGWTLPRRPGPWLLGGLAVLVAAALTPVRILMGVDYAYVRWADGTGAVTATTQYGDTWPSVAGLAWFVSGGAPDHVQHLNLALTGLTVVLAHEVVTRLAGQGTGRLAALLLAASPVHVALARTETMFVLATTLQVAGLLGVLRGGRSGSVLALCSGVLLAWLRPLQVGVVLALAAVAFLRSQRGIAGLLGLAAASRMVPLALALAEQGLPQAAGSHSLGKWLDPRWFVGDGGSSAVLDPTVVPLVLLLPVGAALLGPLRREARPVGLLALAACLPYLHFERPTDVLRFQLPTVTWWCLLAALGWTSLGPRIRLAALALLAAGTWAASRPLGDPFLWQAEDTALREVEGTIPRTATVWVDAPWDRHGAFLLWLNTRGHGTWRSGARGTPAPGDLVWHGRGDAWPRHAAACAEEVLWERRVAVRVGDVEPVEARQVRLALGRVGVCDTDTDGPGGG